MMQAKSPKKGFASFRFSAGDSCWLNAMRKVFSTGCFSIFIIASVTSTATLCVSYLIMVVFP